MEAPKANDLIILVDGQNFISQIRKLFNREFDGQDYLPRNANWRKFFNSIAKMFGAKTLAVYWYGIKELDYSPFVDWSKEDFNQFSEEAYHHWRKLLIRHNARELQNLHQSISAAEEEYLRLRNPKRRKQTVNRWRRICRENQEEMQRRLSGWHQLQDEIARQCPNVEIRRKGWQLCWLTTKVLSKEKGVDIALATDLVLKQSEYDMAILFTSDGDFVPVIEAMQERGKKIGHVEFRTREGEALRGTARRLSLITDFTLDIPWDELKIFLGMPDEPLPQKDH